ncbi:HutD/Ves family protein [Paraburkholderia ferrariae]|uniref:HutD/Ves family protein n=1 Tax=Paraburkholderia ferrariae TaxID=386056 RepID=UPI0005A946F0|nr:HutD family protein [Paraburkholderia ferrariae]
MSGAQALQADARVTLLRGADLVASPWKNGGGVTREIAAAPIAGCIAGGIAGAAAGTALDTFAWRVSVADVAQAGPFSRFEGVDRTLVLLEGAGMMLDEAGPTARTHALTAPLDVARFAGETALTARLVDGPTRDFNLMVRRGAARGTLDVWRTATSCRSTAETLLLFCARGPVAISVNDAAPVTLATGDTLRIDAAQAVDIATQGGGALLAIALDGVSAQAGDPSSGTALPNAMRTS